MIGVLLLVLPAFLQSNSKLKQLLTNFTVWIIIVLIILLTIVLAVYFLFRPTSKKEKERFEDKDNWRGGF